MQANSLTACEPVRARPHRRTEVDVAWIARELGLTHYQQTRTIIEKLRLLAETGFPLPKNPRFVKGVRLTGPLAIDARSVWDRDPVERWFEDDRPPAESAALVAVRRDQAREEMGRRAAGLVLVQAQAGAR